jgi:histidine ammonia-lyase
MGTIAARDCLRVLQLTEQVAAASVLAATQALELRKKQGELRDEQLTKAVRAMQDSVLTEFAFVDEDRPLEADLRHTIARIQRREWQLFI